MPYSSFHPNQSIYNRLDDMNPTKEHYSMFGDFQESALFSKPELMSFFLPEEEDPFEEGSQCKGRKIYLDSIQCRKGRQPRLQGEKSVRFGDETKSASKQKELDQKKIHKRQQKAVSSTTHESVKLKTSEDDFRIGWTYEQQRVEDDLTERSLSTSEEDETNSDNSRSNEELISSYADYSDGQNSSLKASLHTEKRVKGVHDLVVLSKETEEELQKECKQNKDVLLLLLKAQCVQNKSPAENQSERFNRAAVGSRALQKELQDYKDKFSNLQLQMNTIEHQTLKLHLEKQGLEVSLREKVNEHSATVERLQNRVDSLESEKKIAEENIARTERNYEQLKEKLSESLSKQAALEFEVLRVQNNNRRLRLALDMVESEKQKQRNDEQHHNIYDLALERNEPMGSTIEPESFQDSNSSVQTELNTLKAHNLSLERALRLATEEKASSEELSKRAIDALKADNTSLENALNTAKKVKDEELARVRACSRDELTHLEKSLQMMKSKLFEVEKKKKVAERLITTLHEQWCTLVGALSQSFGDISQRDDQELFQKICRMYESSAPSEELLWSFIRTVPKLVEELKRDQDGIRRKLERRDDAIKFLKKKLNRCKIASYEREPQKLQTEHAISDPN